MRYVTVAAVAALALTASTALAQGPSAPQQIASATPAAGSAAGGLPDELPQTLPNTCQAPRYPSALEAARVQGNVLVEFAVDTTGRADASSMRVLNSTHTGFETNAKAAVETCRFRPARMSGRPVRATVRQRIQFVLTNRR
jgi:TonB family protein